MLQTARVTGTDEDDDRGTSGMDWWFAGGGGGGGWGQPVYPVAKGLKRERKREGCAFDDMVLVGFD